MPPVTTPITAYVGSFTTAERQARGEGIGVFGMEPESGAWTHRQTLGGLVNPSFLKLSRDHRFLYAVHGDADHASAFAIDAADGGRLRLLNQAATGGRNGVRQDIDPSGRWMVVANYASGTVAVLEIRADGSLADQHQLVPLEGTPGPHPVQQTSSHPHDVVFDPSGRFVVIPDKGLDRVFTFALDAARGLLSPAGGGGFYDAQAGAGPRHMAFHPRLPLAWVLNELDSTITTCRWDAEAGVLHPVERIGSLPPGFTARNTTAELAVSEDGRFLYASNRGHDSVVACAVDATTGTLRPFAWAPTQGRVPRFIGLAPGGRFLYAANEQGDSILPLAVEAATGALQPAAAAPMIPCHSPAVIAFATGIG